MILKTKFSNIYKILSILLIVLLALAAFGINFYSIRYYLKEIKPYRAIIDTYLENADPAHSNLPPHMSALINADLGCPNSAKETEKQLDCESRRNYILTKLIYRHTLEQGFKDYRHLQVQIKQFFISGFILSSLSEPDKNTLFCELFDFGYNPSKYQDRLIPINGCNSFAQYHFGKPLAALSLEESAIIIAITKSPSYYSVPERLKQRKQILLDRVKSFQ